MGGGWGIWNKWGNPTGVSFNGGETKDAKPPGEGGGYGEGGG